jgi:hypothetical protein
VEQFSDSADLSRSTNKSEKFYSVRSDLTRLLTTDKLNQLLGSGFTLCRSAGTRSIMNDLVNGITCRL